MSKKKENPPTKKRIRDLSPEHLRWEAELLREQREEADRQDRPALRRLIESLEQEGVEEKPDLLTRIWRRLRGKSN